MIAIGKKDPAVEKRKKSASMPPMLKFEEKEAPALPEPEEPIADIPDVEPDATADYGAKMMGDMMAPLTAAGMDEATAKSALVQVFKAAVACLEGGGEPEAEPALEELLG